MTKFSVLQFVLKSSSALSLLRQLFRGFAAIGNICRNLEVLLPFTY